MPDAPVQHRATVQHRGAVQRRAVAQLPEELANKIAAGEVVTRPASVVKELLDNAVDAAARNIDVEISGGGTTLIRVVDDGHGMTPDDARLALSRHATSKIRTAADLDNITTLGFRGEALPSIAAVSKLSLRTRVQEQDAGLQLVVQGGKTVTDKPCGCPVGTTIEVAELFYNVPARRKFLRAVSTESAHVSAIVRAAALAHPSLRLTLIRDGRMSRRYPPAATRAERVALVLKEKALWHCSAERGPMQIDAYLSPPERARQGASGLHLFVNGRNIVDRAISRAIASAYGEALDRGRFPRGALFLSLPPELVDVNVHPQKAEVRFAHARAVTDAVFATVSAELAARLALPTGAHPHTFKPGRPQPDRNEAWSWARPDPATAAQAKPGAGASGAAPGRAHWPIGRGAPWQTGKGLSRSGGDGPWQRGQAATASWSQSSSAQETPRGQGAAAGGSGAQPLAQATAPPSAQATAPPSNQATAPPSNQPPAKRTTETSEVLGLLQDRYLVCAWRNEVLVVDAQRARAAWLHAQALEAFRAGRLASQRLMFPQVEQVAARLQPRLEQDEAALARLGFDLRPAGEGTAMLHALPRLFAQLDPALLLAPLLRSLARGPLDEPASLALLKQLSEQSAASCPGSTSSDRGLWQWLQARVEQDGREALIGLVGTVTLPRTERT